MSAPVLFKPKRPKQVSLGFFGPPPTFAREMFPAISCPHFPTTRLALLPRSLAPSSLSAPPRHLVAAPAHRLSSAVERASSGEAMEEEIRKEFQSNGFSIGGAGPEDAAQILSTRKYKRPHRLFPF